MNKYRAIKTREIWVTLWLNNVLAVAEAIKRGIMIYRKIIEGNKFVGANNFDERIRTQVRARERGI